MGKDRVETGLASWPLRDVLAASGVRHLARPWINAFMPHLSGFFQPLAGTVAIYRDELVNMRIPVNYGVEMAMLLQAVEQAGL